tara:strand:+ start:2873 stop:3199 length:327 start_codon:yes stop_codon:yes gene_type:complete
MDYPKDADGKALHIVAADGNDMSEPMDIEYIVVTATEQAAFLAATVVTQRGYSFRISFDEDYQDWICYCTKCMIPGHGAIVACQCELDAMCKPFGGYSDGWSTEGNQD